LERNAIEPWYSLFKARIKRFWKRFPYHGSLEISEPGQRLGALSIIYAGGEKAGSIDDMKSKTDVVQQLKQLLKLREKARTIFKNI